MRGVRGAFAAVACAMVTFRDGAATGEMPCRLDRGALAARALLAGG
jgi:hypothetical protein